MFEELTDQEILEWKKQIREFLLTNHSTLSMSNSHQGISFTLTHQNAWKILEDLTREQRRRQRRNNPFIQLDLRNV